MLTAEERRNLQAPLIRSEHDGLARRLFVTTPWFSPVLIHCDLIEDARQGNESLRLEEPDQFVITVENGEARYRLVEHDPLNDCWEARLVESWMDPTVYADWLKVRP